MEYKRPDGDLICSNLRLGVYTPYAHEIAIITHIYIFSISTRVINSASGTANTRPLKV